MGDDLSSVGKKLGLLAGLLGNISTATCGVAGKRTVAIRCRGGWTIMDLFTFNGPLEPEDRYDGMKLAFGEDNEILKPRREGPGMTHTELNRDDYGKLLVAVQNRKRSFNKTKNESRVTNDAVRCYRATPIWEWAVKQKYGLLLSIVYGLPSLILVPAILAERVWHGDTLPVIIYCALFMSLKIYVHFILHINRYVCYIKIGKDAMSETFQETWQTLRAAEDTSTKMPTAEVSVADIRSGQVRLLNEDTKEYLLVPVMGLQPFVSFDRVQWLFVARRLRGPLLTISWLAGAITDHTWSVAFAFMAVIQASLQDDVARVFLADTSTYCVNWFRMLDNHPYPEEYELFRQELILPFNPRSSDWFRAS